MKTATANYIEANTVHAHVLDVEKVMNFSVYALSAAIAYAAVKLSPLLQGLTGLV